MQTHQEQKPEDFTWEYQEDLVKAWQAFLDREKFSYDLTSDPVYQQYKDQYTHLGQLAMMDTMGQAAALTGGYGTVVAAKDPLELWDNIGRNYRRVLKKED